MAKIDFNAAAIEAASTRKPQEAFWFNGHPSFGLIVYGTGRKSYAAQATIKGTKRYRRLIIGDACEIPSGTALDKANELLKAMKAGVDPKQAVEENAPQPAIESIRVRREDVYTLRDALDDYLADKGKKLRASTLEYYKMVLETHVSDWFDLALADLDRKTIKERHRQIGDTKPYVANMVCRVLSAIFNHAIDEENFDGANPARLKGIACEEEPRERTLPAKRFADFYAALDRLDNQVFADFLRLLLFTGMRRNEAAQMTWSEVDFEDGVIRLPPHRHKMGRKTKRAFILPMSDLVREVLERRYENRRMNDFVFPSTKGNGPIFDPKRVFWEIEEATGLKLSSHDLRRAFITVAQGSGLDWYDQRRLANRSTRRDVHANYVIDDIEDFRIAAQKVADRIKTLIAPKGNVETLRPAA